MVQKNRSDTQYEIRKISNPTLSAPAEPEFDTGKTALSMEQKRILDAKKINLLTGREILKRI